MGGRGLPHSPEPARGWLCCAASPWASVPSWGKEEESEETSLRGAMGGHCTPLLLPGRAHVDPATARGRALRMLPVCAQGAGSVGGEDGPLPTPCPPCTPSPRPLYLLLISPFPSPFLTSNTLLSPTLTPFLLLHRKSAHTRALHREASLRKQAQPVGSLQDVASGLGLMSYDVIFTSLFRLSSRGLLAAAPRAPSFAFCLRPFVTQPALPPPREWSLRQLSQVGTPTCLLSNARISVLC